MRLGRGAQYVFEVRLVVRITRARRMPERVASVANMRRHILSVVDLQRFQDQGVEGFGPATRCTIVVCEEKEETEDEITI